MILTMTIEIHNSSDRYSIYPVLTTGAHAPIDTWLQAAFRIPKSQVDNYPYPNPKTFRLYFNPTGNGIPPNGSITVTLPLYTQLVPSDQVNSRSCPVNTLIGGMADEFHSTQVCIPMACPRRLL